MSRLPVYPWRKHLTAEEREVIARLELRIRNLSDKIKPYKKARQAIVARASKRAQRDDHGE